MFQNIIWMFFPIVLSINVFAVIKFIALKAPIIPQK